MSRNENLLGDDVARAELDRIIGFFEVDPEGEEWQDSERRLLQAIKKGRVELDEQSNLVIMRLVAPIELQNGQTIAELKFKEPSASDLKVFDKYKEAEKMAKTIHLAAKMTGQPVGIIDRMGSRDVATMGALASLFF